MLGHGVAILNTVTSKAWRKVALLSSQVWLEFTFSMATPVMDIDVSIFLLKEASG